MLNKTRPTHRLALALVWLGAATALAVERPTCKVYRIDKPIVVDGKLDESAWQCVPRAAGFVLLGGPTTFALKQTTFAAAWDDRALYLGAVCLEPDVDRLSAEMKDGGALWMEDSVEFFFVPSPPNYIQFVVSAIGSKTCVHHAPTWQAAAARTAKTWVAEIRIPWTALGRTPQPNQRWRFNLARNHVGCNRGQRHSTWSPLTADFHDLARFGELHFMADTLQPAQAAAVTAADRNQRFRPLMVRLESLLAEAEHELADIRRTPHAGLSPDALDELAQTIGQLRAAVKKGDTSYAKLEHARHQASTVLENIYKIRLTQLLKK